jgi:hypothetical protein
MARDQERFLELARSRFRMNFFMFTRLPAAFFSGLRIQSINAGACAVSVPYKWFSKNPFRSTYFACLAMAAEMSSGMLAMLHVYRSQPSVSMLVLTLTGNFHKKATGLTTFRCEDGPLIEEAIRKAKETGVGVTVETLSKGYSASGDLVAEFRVLWTFKVKSKR